MTFSVMKSCGSSKGDKTESPTKRRQNERSNPYDKDVTSKDKSGRPPTRAHIKQPLWFAYKVLGDAGAVTSGGIHNQAISWLMNGVWPRQTIKTLMHCVHNDGMQFPLLWLQC